MLHLSLASSFLFLIKYKTKCAVKTALKETQGKHNFMPLKKI